MEWLGHSMILEQGTLLSIPRSVLFGYYRLNVNYQVQLTLELGTGPLEVDGLKVQLTVSTVVPTGCSTVITALVNDTSVIVSVQLEFGQPGAPGIGDTGGFVVTLNETLPFLILDAGMAWDPVKVTEAGFCPGG